MQEPAMKTIYFFTLFVLALSGSAASVSCNDRPETWFHLIGGNVSREGLTADLEAIKAAGLGGIHLFHGQIGKNQTWPGVTNPIPCLSANWDGMVAHAAAECRRLGLTFRMQNCPGWSMSGGPWIRPENAMRNLCFSQATVRRGSDVKLSLPEIASDGTERDYHDLFVLAFPTPTGDGDGWLAPTETKSPSVQVRVFTFKEPVTVRTLELPSTSELNHGRAYDPETTAVFEAETAPGVWQTVVREALPPGNWQDNRKGGSRYTLACDEATARTWRLTLESADPLRLGKVRLSSAARMDQWEGLAGWTLRGLVDRGTPRQDPSSWIDPKALVDLTGRLRPDDTLDWTPADDRRWTVLRIGHVNGGYRNGPAPQEATGWECSKLSRKGIEANYAAYVGRLAKGLLKGRLDGLVVDSWECYRDNWTDGLEKIFAARCGYGLVRWLPAVFGWVIGAPSETERFLRDWRGLLGSLVEENYYGRLAELAHADGLAAQYETAFGDALAGDLLKFWKHADIPMCEFWRPTTPTGVGSANFKPVLPCVSAAHIYGKRRVAAEALTNCALTWDEALRDFKPVLDRHFAKGVTFPVFHTYTHNPQVGFKKPGTSFGYFIGTPFLRGQTWWPFMPRFTDYCARCTEFLEAGRPVVDVLRVLGDGLGHKPDEKTPHFGNRFKDDYVNQDVLLNRLSVRDGRLTLPDGLTYPVLWIPQGTYLDERSRAKIAALRQAGACVADGVDPTTGLVPDVVSPGDALLWYHRETAEGDRYFVAAPDAPVRGAVRFRGRAVDLDLETGESRFVRFSRDGVCTVTDPVTDRPPLAKPTGKPIELTGYAHGAERASFVFSARRGERVVVDLGQVEQCADVSLNGRLVGKLWCAPYRIDLTDAVTDGENRLEVVVTATWHNRLLAEASLSEEQRTTWTLYGPKAGSPMRPAGLYGKVSLWKRDAAVKEPVFLFRGADRDQYGAQGVCSFAHDAGGHPKFAWKKGASELRLRYAARWGLKPFHGPREMRLTTDGSCSGTAVLKVRPLGGRKEVTFPAAWRETTVFRTDLPDEGLYEFVDVVFRPDPASGGAAVVTGLVAHLDQTDAAALRLDVETGTPYHALVGSRRPVFLLTNPSGRTVAWKGTIALRDFFGRGLDVPFDVTAKPQETVRLPLAHDVPWKGYWSAIADVRGGDGSVASAKTTFSLIDDHPVTPVLDDGTFRIGTVCHIEGYAPYDREVCYDALAAMGAKIVRCNLCMMGLMQPKGPDQFLTALQDEVLENFARHGLAVDTLLTWAPRWSFSEAHRKICDSGVGIGPITPEPEPFAAFCERLARRYGTKIAYYETSNEVDLRQPEWGTLEELIACQKAAYAAIKRACPEAKVLTPGFGPFGSVGPQVRIRNCQEDFCDRARDFYDVHAVHAHGGFLWFADNLKNVFMKWRGERGLLGKPWFPNETALGTSRGQEADAAEAVWKKIVLCRANGAVDHCWYNLRAKGWDDNDGETSYGMLTADYHPRMTYPAFSALAAVMGAFHETHRFASVNDRFVFRLRPQRGVDTLVVAGWDENALEKPWKLTVRTDARRAFLVDLMGNAEEVAVRDGATALPLNRRPCAVRLEGATFAEADETALLAPPPPIRPTARIPRLDIAKRMNRPDVVLKDHRQVRELYEANPVYRHRCWQGEKDLSVRAWLDIGKNETVFRQPNSLRLVFEVSDDVERLPDGAEDASGDSAEIEFRFPSQNGGWKILMTRAATGAPSVQVQAAPPGFAPLAAAGKVVADIVRTGGVTRCDVRLPFSDFGISPETDIVSGFRFNLRVYDDDGEGRDGWIELKPANVKDGAYDRYPLIVFDGKWRVR